MEMHQVRYFLALSETLNFTRAAERCNVAQPSLTVAIRKLEAELGGPLFRRERNRSHLTDLGRLMKPHFERIRDTGEVARAEAMAFWDREKAPLRLGVMCTIGPERMVGLFARLRSEIPSLDVELKEAPGSALVAHLMDGDLDVALIGLPEYPDRLDARPLLYRDIRRCLSAGAPVRGPARGSSEGARIGKLPRPGELRAPAVSRHARYFGGLRGQRQIPQRARGLGSSHDCRRHGRLRGAGIHAIEPGHRDAPARGTGG